MLRSELPSKKFNPIQIFYELSLAGCCHKLSEFPPFTDVVKKIMATSPISDWNTDCKITDSYLLEQNGVWVFYGNNLGRVENLTNLDNPTRTTEQVIQLAGLDFLVFHPKKVLRYYKTPVN